MTKVEASSAKSTNFGDTNANPLMTPQKLLEQVPLQPIPKNYSTNVANSQNRLIQCASTHQEGASQENQINTAQFTPNQAERMMQNRVPQGLGQYRDNNSKTIFPQPGMSQNHDQNPRNMNFRPSNRNSGSQYSDSRFHTQRTSGNNLDENIQLETEFKGNGNNFSFRYQQNSQSIRNLQNRQFAHQQSNNFGGNPRMNNREAIGNMTPRPEFKSQSRLSNIPRWNGIDTNESRNYRDSFEKQQRQTNNFQVVHQDTNRVCNVRINEENTLQNAQFSDQNNRMKTECSQGNRNQNGEVMNVEDINEQKLDPVTQQMKFATYESNMHIEEFPKKLSETGINFQKLSQNSHLNSLQQDRKAPEVPANCPPRNAQVSQRLPNHHNLETTINLPQAQKKLLQHAAQNQVVVYANGLSDCSTSQPASEKKSKFSDFGTGEPNPLSKQNSSSNQSIEQQTASSQVSTPRQQFPLPKVTDKNLSSSQTAQIDSKPTNIRIEGTSLILNTKENQRLDTQRGLTFARQITEKSNFEMVESEQNRMLGNQRDSIAINCVDNCATTAGFQVNSVGKDSQQQTKYQSNSIQKVNPRLEVEEHPINANEQALFARKEANFSTNNIDPVSSQQATYSITAQNASTTTKNVNNNHKQEENSEFNILNQGLCGGLSLNNISLPLKNSQNLLNGSNYQRQENVRQPDAILIKKNSLAIPGTISNPAAAKIPESSQDQYRPHLAEPMSARTKPTNTFHNQMPVGGLSTPSNKNARELAKSQQQQQQGPNTDAQIQIIHPPRPYQSLISTPNQPRYRPPRYDIEEVPQYAHPKQAMRQRFGQNQQGYNQSQSYNQRQQFNQQNSFQNYSKPQRFSQTGGYNNMNHPKPARENGFSNTREGDWYCHSCNNLNFAKRISCNNCGFPKPPDEIMKTPIIKLGPPGLFREGDWQCFNCRNINFKKRDFCNKCGEQKPPEYIEREQELDESSEPQNLATFQTPKESRVQNQPQMVLNSLEEGEIRASNPSNGFAQGSNSRTSLVLNSQGKLPVTPSSLPKTPNQTLKPQVSYSQSSHNTSIQSNENMMMNDNLSDEKYSYVNQKLTYSDLSNKYEHKLSRKENNSNNSYNCTSEQQLCKEQSNHSYIPEEAEERERRHEQYEVMIKEEGRVEEGLRARRQEAMDSLMMNRKVAVNTIKRERSRSLEKRREDEIVSQPKTNK